MTPTLKSFVIIRAESSFRIFLVMGGTFLLSFLFAYTMIQPLSRLDSIESIERRLSFHPKERSNDTVDEFDEELYTFKILQLADLHFGEAEFTDWGPLQDVKSEETSFQHIFALKQKAELITKTIEVISSRHREL